MQMARTQYCLPKITNSRGTAFRSWRINSLIRILCIPLMHSLCKEVQYSQEETGFGLGRISRHIHPFFLYPSPRTAEGSYTLSRHALCCFKHKKGGLPCASSVVCCSSSPSSASPRSSFRGVGKRKW